MAYTFTPIGLFHGPRASKSALPRQGFLSGQSGYIEFEKGFDHKLALSGVEKMSHVWVLYIFHEAHSLAKPLVRPPRAPDKLIGVYATRSPYRPNPIGMTLASVDRIERGRLYLSHMDLLHGTPILDIKPYVTDSDRPETPQQGWIDQIESWNYTVGEFAHDQCEWLYKHGLTEIYDVLEAQLGTNPLQPNRKRIRKFEGNNWVLSYRTWRLFLEVRAQKCSSTLLRIESGYSALELTQNDDPYHDKELHKGFRKKFST